MADARIQHRDVPKPDHWADLVSALDGGFIDSLVFSGSDGPDFLACHASFGA